MAAIHCSTILSCVQITQIITIFFVASMYLNMCCVVFQIALATTQIWWTTEVGIAFARLEEGYENALKDYFKKQVTQLNTLITLLIGELSRGDRQKIMTICTIDVHARDVVSKLISTKVSLTLSLSGTTELTSKTKLV